MARTRTSVNQNALLLLKHFVKSKINLDCSSFSHIHQLQHDIQKSTGECLSLQTLNRLFGIIPNGFNPSINTLDTLSRYVDYKSFFELEMLNAEKGSGQVQTSFISRFVYSVFATITPGPNIEPGILQVVKNITKLMADDRQLAAEIYYTMAPSPFGRKYFFEQFIYIDALDNVYGNGLKYYLLNASNREQKFFVYVINCYRYFLTGNIILFQEYFNLVNEFRQSEIMAFHPLMIDRYYATLVYKQVLGKKNHILMGNLKHEPVDFDMLASHPESFYSAGYLVGKALLLAGEFERSWDILNSDKVKPFFVASCLQEEYATQVNILKLVSGFFSGNISKNKALVLYAELNEKPLPTLGHDYYLFFLLLMKRSLFLKLHTQKTVNEQIDQLVLKTGFVYFRDYSLMLVQAELV